MEGRTTRPTFWHAAMSVLASPRVPRYCANGAGVRMRVILNSDVLYGDFARHGLPAGVLRLADACADGGHVLVIPETALLEVERRQREIVVEERKQISGAVATLSAYGANVGAISAEELAPDVDVRDLFNQLGVEIEFPTPTIDDFRDAHARACLHESPHPPDGKSDEMRDLIIWSVSLRLAAADGHGLLVSKDRVHVHPRGDTEARESNLARVDSLEDALDYLEVKTAAGAQLEAMLAPSWERLAQAGVPLGNSPMLLSVRDAQFVQGWAGPSSASGSVRVRGEDGKMIFADVEIDVSSESMARVTMSNVRADDRSLEDVTVTADYQPSDLDKDHERMAALREVLGGDS